MRYIGGKSKIAKPLAQAILGNSRSRKFYLEPFVGGGAVFPLIAPEFSWSVAGDMHGDLVQMWNALIFDGWEPPEFVSEDEYQSLRNADPSPLRGFVGFGTSFGGKWFGGYARGNAANGKARNYIDESRRSILSDIATLHDKLTPSELGRFRNQSYSEWKPLPGTVIYCDPPYANTQGYTTGDFDSSSFWDKCEEWSNIGCEVFVSEYSAPSGWREIWSKEHRTNLEKNGTGFHKTVERLFTR